MTLAYFQGVFLKRRIKFHSIRNLRRDSLRRDVLSQVGVLDFVAGRLWWNTQGEGDLSGVFSLETLGCRALVFAALCAVPLAVHAEWFAGDAAPGMTGCALETGEISLFDGYQDTQLRLGITDEALRVRTDSNIDLSFNDVGLAVDGKDFIAADAVVDEKDVLFSSGTEAILEQFIRGHSVTLYLRFWPSYPATQRYEARFSLMGFTRAYNNYKACRNKMPT